MKTALQRSPKTLNSGWSYLDKSPLIGATPHRACCPPTTRALGSPGSFQADPIYLGLTKRSGATYCGRRSVREGGRIRAWDLGAELERVAQEVRARRTSSVPPPSTPVTREWGKDFQVRSRPRRSVAVKPPQRV